MDATGPICKQMASIMPSAQPPSQGDGRRSGRHSRNYRHRPLAANKQRTSQEACHDRVEADLKQRLHGCAPTTASRWLMDRCLRELMSLVQQLGRDWSVEPFGSSANGFGMASSDLDATVYQRGRLPRHDDQRSAVDILGTRLVPLLYRHQDFEVIETIFGARIPILKLRFEGTLDVDLSCHNLYPLVNTRLLKAYCDIDIRIAELGRAVKIWAKAAGVCGAGNKCLSAYAFAIMTIYFLLHGLYASLPLLPVEGCTLAQREPLSAHVERIRRDWHCRFSVASLLQRFFHFYTHEFRWGFEVVSLRKNGRRLASDQFFCELRGTHRTRLHIEDPFQLERNLHCHLGDAEELQLRSALKLALAAIQNGETPVGLAPVQTPEPALPDNVAAASFTEVKHVDTDIRSAEASAVDKEESHVQQIAPECISISTAVASDSTCCPDGEGSSASDCSICVPQDDALSHVIATVATGRLMDEGPDGDEPLPNDTLSSSSILRKLGLGLG